MLNNSNIDFSSIKVLNDILKKSQEEYKEKPNNKFHQLIERDKKFILNLFRNNSFYKDSMYGLEKESKGIFYYNRLIKNIKNKSSFLKILLQTIERINRTQKKPLEKKRKLKLNYSKPQLELMKHKKMEIEQRNKLKLFEKDKSKLFENRIFSSLHSSRNKNKLSLAGKSIIENIDSNLSSNNNNVSRINSGFKKRIFSGMTKNMDYMSTKNKSLSRSMSTNSILSGRSNNNHIQYNTPEKRIKQFNFILNKCQDEIIHGNKIGDKLEKFTNNINDSLALVKQNGNNKVDNNIQDQKIIEDKITNKQKYKLLEIEKFNELKKKIDTKISDNYVYFNRKEYAEQAKEKREEEEYDLYLDDINKINEELEKKKVREKEKLHEIENLVEDVYKKKIYLNKKLNNYDLNRINEKEHEQYMKDNVIFDYNYFLLNEKKQEEHKGTFIPKLLLKKKENDKEKKYIIRKRKVN